MLDVLADPTVASVLAIVAVVLTLAAVILALLLARWVAVLREQHVKAFPSSAEDVVAVLGRHSEQLTTLREDLATVHANTEHLRELLRRTTSRVGIVRYDAFEDMGGALSFSAALLDEHGDGLVVTAINGRSETRAYGKPVLAGESDDHLSHEEVAAVSAAMEGRPPATIAPPSLHRRRRRRAS